jgi:type VI protein secretion system component VasK
LFDDLPLETKILIGLLGPLALTLICWLVGPLLAGCRNWAGNRSWSGFWLMLLVSYLVFAVALAGGRFLSGNDKADPSSQLFQ